MLLFIFAPSVCLFMVAIFIQNKKLLQGQSKLSSKFYCKLQTNRLYHYSTSTDQLQSATPIGTNYGL